jgi:hypothetical protein
VCCACFSRRSNLADLFAFGVGVVGVEVVRMPLRSALEMS